MNQRRRYKAKRRRRLIKRTMAILLINHRNAKAFLAERAKTVRHVPFNPYRAFRQLERLLPYASVAYSRPSRIHEVRQGDV